MLFSRFGLINKLLVPQTTLYLFLIMLLVQAKANAQVKTKLTRVEIFDIVKSLPTSAEIHWLLKKKNYTYQRYLHQENNQTRPQKLSNKDIQAITLGILTSRVLQAEVYEKQDDAQSYLAAMKGLIDSLKLKTISSYESLYLFIKKSKDTEYLVFRTGSFFEQFKDFCYQKNKHDWLILIISGDWVESVYTLLNTTIKNQSVQLKHRVLEQDLIIEQLLSLYNNYESNKLVMRLKKQLLRVYDLLKRVKVIDRNGQLKYSKLTKRKLKKMARLLKRFRFGVGAQK